MEKFDLLHPADQLIMIMNRIYGYGMTTTSGGNLSIKDENGDLWITPGGIDKGTLNRNDIIKVSSDGSIQGPHKPSSEFPFHQAIYEARPDIKAILHAHPPALVSFSVVRKIPDTSLIPNAHLVCGEVGMAQYALPGSKELGDRIADVFKRGLNTVMLENHGIVVAGKDLFQAFMRFETLDFCARLEIRARRIGKPIPLKQDQLRQLEIKQHVEMDEFIPRTYSSSERESRHQICNLIHRGYDQMLFTSTQGTFSQRLSDESFIITPYKVDRKYIDEADIVRVEKGWREAGKMPSRSVNLHQMIYENHPKIRAVLIAHPPNIMAFGITHQQLDTRTIPESYVMLRDIPQLPYGVDYLDMQKIVDTLSVSTPLVILQNDSIIVTGESLLQAFDRLEVAEYTAKAVIATRDLGDMVTINEEEVEALKKAFKLK